MCNLAKPYLLWNYLLIALLVIFVKDSKAQKNYASGTITGGVIGTGILAGSPFGLSRSSGISTVGNITFLSIPTNNISNYYYAGTIKTTTGSPTTVGSSSILGINETVPILVQANKGLSAALVNVSGASSFIQFRYDDAITERTTSYVKLKQRPVRNSTIDLATLGILGLTSSNMIVGEVYSGALQPQNVPLGNVNQHVGTAIGTSGQPTKTDLIIDKNGDWYAAIMPTASGNYNSVRLTAQFPSDLNLLSLANSIEFNAYHAFTDAGSSCNFRPMYTNEGKASGITLDIGVAISALDLSELVKNPTNAIDDDINTYSSLSSGVANVGLLNQVSQSFYFDHKGSATDNLRLQLGLNTSLINLDVLSLNGIKVKGYNGGLEVFSKGLGELTQLLSLNLLNLVTINGTTHKKLDLTFNPGLAFDRIEIIFDQGLLDVGLLGDAMRIYDVSMASSMPSITVQPTNALAANICEGSDASFTLTASASNNGTISSYKWQYLNSNNNWVDAPSGNTNTLTITGATYAMNNRWYRAKITGGNALCPQDIYSNEVQLTVKPKATASDIVAANVTICQGHSTTLTASSAITNPTFKWYNNAALTGSPVSSTHQLNITPTSTTSYWVTVEGTAHCQNAPHTAKEVLITVNPILPPPVLSITAN